MAPSARRGKAGRAGPDAARSVSGADPWAPAPGTRADHERMARDALRVFEGRDQRPRLSACRAELRRACCRCLCCGRTSSDRYVRLIDVAMIAAVTIPTLPITLYLMLSTWLVYRCSPGLPVPKWVPAWAYGLFSKAGSAGSLEADSGYRANDDGTGASDGSDGAADRMAIETPGMPWRFPFAFEPACIRFFGRDNRPCPTRVPTSEYFDPGKPTLLYVHGIEPGTTVRGFRETFVTPTGVTTIFPCIPTGNLWLDRGYNIAIFYWNQFSDDQRPAVERKIYVGGHMTYTCMARGRDGGDAKRGSTGAPQSHMLVRRLTRSSERLGACTDGSPTTAGEIVVAVVRQTGLPKKRTVPALRSSWAGK